MEDRRRITFTASELRAMKHGLSNLIVTQFFEVATAETRSLMQLRASECASAIAAYRKTWPSLGYHDLVQQKADRYLRRLTDATSTWMAHHGTD